MRRAGACLGFGAGLAAFPRNRGRGACCGHGGAGLIIRGLQITGAARRIVAADERIRQLAQLEARYSFLGQLAAGPSKLREPYAPAVYRLQPARIVLIDNTKGFGHKETLEISP